MLKIHHDDIPPYYTIRIHTDGREKQTVRSKLTVQAGGAAADADAAALCADAAASSSSAGGGFPAPHPEPQKKTRTGPNEAALAAMAAADAAWTQSCVAKQKAKAPPVPAETAGTAQNGASAAEATAPGSHSASGRLASEGQPALAHSEAAQSGPAAPPGPVFVTSKAARVESELDAEASSAKAQQQQASGGAGAPGGGAAPSAGMPLQNGYSAAAVGKQRAASIVLPAWPIGSYKVCLMQQQEDTAQHQHQPRAVQPAAAGAADGAGAVSMSSSAAVAVSSQSGGGIDSQTGGGCSSATNLTHFKAERAASVRPVPSTPTHPVMVRRPSNKAGGGGSARVSVSSSSKAASIPVGYSPLNGPVEPPRLRSINLSGAFDHAAAAAASSPGSSAAALTDLSLDAGASSAAEPLSLQNEADLAYEIELRKMEAENRWPWSWLNGVVELIAPMPAEDAPPPVAVTLTFERQTDVFPVREGNPYKV